jgi:hypothetical protein
MSTYAAITVVLVVAALAIALPIVACEARLRRMYGDDRLSRRDEWDGEVR